MSICEYTRILVECNEVPLHSTLTRQQMVKVAVSFQTVKLEMETILFVVGTVNIPHFMVILYKTLCMNAIVKLQRNFLLPSWFYFVVWSNSVTRIPPLTVIDGNDSNSVLKVAEKASSFPWQWHILCLFLSIWGKWISEM